MKEYESRVKNLQDYVLDYGQFDAHIFEFVKFPILKHQVHGFNHNL